MALNNVQVQVQYNYTSAWDYLAPAVVIAFSALALAGPPKLDVHGTEVHSWYHANGGSGCLCRDLSHAAGNGSVPLYVSREEEADEVW